MTKATEENITGNLENWYVVNYPKGSVFMGCIYNDSKGRFVDGTEIYTSKVLKVKDGLAYTRNSIYKLGKEKG